VKFLLAAGIATTHRIYVFSPGPTTGCATIARPTGCALNIRRGVDQAERSVEPRFVHADGSWRQELGPGLVSGNLIASAYSSPEFASRSEMFASGPK
jgi:hypothetical protein